MEVKTFEIRDRGTFIPVLAVRLGSDNEADRFLAARAGYGPTRHTQERYILLVRLDGGEGSATSDPHKWGDCRTMSTAHQHIAGAWEQLVTGVVIDVEWLLGETEQVKESEAFTCRDQEPKAPDESPTAAELLERIDTEIFELQKLLVELRARIGAL